MKVVLSLGDPRGDPPRLSAAGAARPLRLLLSYHYYKGDDLDALLECLSDQHLDLLADSGAFSVWTSGATISVREYAEWLNRWKHRFSAAAALDVISDPKASLRQTEELRQLVDPSLEIVPVFHANDGSFSWLDEYVRRGYSYIGLAPNALRRQGGSNLISPWITHCYERTPPGQRFHGFAVTSWDLMKRFPWYSVDSSSWTSVFRFAQLALFDRTRGRFQDIEMRDPRSPLRHQALLAQYRLRPHQLRSKDYDRALLCGVSVESWRRAEEWLAAHSAGRGVFLARTRQGEAGATDRLGAIARGSATYLALCGHPPTDAATVGRGIKKAYLACGSAPIEGAPNRPEGVASGLKTFLATADKGHNGSLSQIAKGMHDPDRPDH